MFPSQRPQLLHGSVKKPGNKSSRGGGKPGRDGGGGRLLLGRSTALPSAETNPIMKIVSIPIPYKQSTTAPSRFVPIDVEDFSHLTISRQPLVSSSGGGGSGGGGRTTRRGTREFDEEDYITAAEKILPALTETSPSRTPTPTTTATQLGSNYLLTSRRKNLGHSAGGPSKLSTSSSSGATSLKPNAGGGKQRTGTAQGGRTGDGGRESIRKLHGRRPKAAARALSAGRSLAGAGGGGGGGNHSWSPQSSNSTSIDSITSSIVKPIEIKYRNKYAADMNKEKSRRNIGLDSFLDARTVVERGRRRRDGAASEVDDSSSSSDLTLYSNIEDQVNSTMSQKTAEERKLMVKLCNEAMRRREAHLTYYQELVGQDKEQVQRTVANYQPNMNQSELQELMLTLVTEREAAIDKKRTTRPVTCWHQINSENTGKHYLPVYCVQGRTYLGKHTDHPRQPHTFAHLTSLKNPTHDPPGYKRYSKLINMKGFNNNEILIHARGNQVRFDAFALSKKKPIEIDPTSSTTDMLRRSKFLNLPKGVYPERLSIGRSSSGILVIQEPWKF